jgi:hypothetical protein
MRTIIAIVLGIGLLSGCAGAGKWDMRHGNDTGLVGTWERLDETPPQYSHIKMLTATHFVWVSYDRSTGIVMAMGGGTYEFDGRVYIERLLFGGETLAGEFIGEDQFFTANLDGDEWRHEGTLSNGFQVKEVWRRIE